jgi:hypothetical protein
MTTANPWLADRVRETSTATAPGTGSIFLTNVAANGYQTFSSQFSDSSYVQYCAVDPLSNTWECGIGSFVVAGGIRILRDPTRILSGSSGAGVLASFTNGNLDVFCTVSASNVVSYGATNGTFNLNIKPPLANNGISSSLGLSTTQATVGGSAPVTIIPAAAPTTYAGSAGYVTIASGKGGWINAGGAVNVTAGAGGDSGSGPTAGGAVTITGGAGGVIGSAGSDGGRVRLTGGGCSDTTPSHAAGPVQLFGGSSSTGANGGDIVIQSGSASAFSGSGGSVTITPGAGNPAGGGTNGTLTLKSNATANPNVITIKDDGSTGAQIGFFTATPIARPTTAITGTAPVTNSGTTVNTGTTFEGYTLAQVVTALKSLGLLT